MRKVLVPVSMLRALILVCGSLSVSVVSGVNIQVIDAFDYADDKSARDVWIPVEESLPVEMPREPIAGRKALRLPCDMTGKHRRAAWDRKVDLDFTAADRFSFWLYVDDPAKVASYYSFYFHSGEGWYAASFTADKGWQQIILHKSQFGIEGIPAGWNRVTGIRVSAWKARDAITFMAIDDLVATSTDVVVILGNLSAQGPEWKTARAQADRMGKILEGIGIDAGVLNDTDVEAGALAGRKIAIFAYSPTMSDKEVTATEDFIRAGGKAVIFYSIPARLLTLLGLESTGWKPQEYEGQFASIRFQITGVQGMPASVSQSSWNINLVRPVEARARVVGEWFDAKGNATGFPAVVMSDTGVYMSHILLADDIAGKEQMLLAIVGHYLPDVWPNAAQKAIARMEIVGEYTTIKDLATFVTQSNRLTARERLSAGLRLAAKARTASVNKDYPRAVELAKTAHAQLAYAYCAAQKPRPNEMRAVWCHSAFGVAGMTWEEAIKALKDHGMTAIVPNMLWAGRAYYRSAVLPVDPSVETKGDQIAECVAAGKKYGVQLHVWKVNWNLATAPKEFLERLRAEKRTQKNPQGQDIDWLCPSHPANFELERDSMLEVVRNYDIDGIHFDYIRYPGLEGCYCEGCHQHFEQQYEVTIDHWPQDVLEGELRTKFLEFRRSNITRLVETVSLEAHRLKPNIKVSAAVFSNWPNCRDSVGQDWAAWIEKGYLDFVCPMNYTNSPRAFENMVTNQLESAGHKIPFIPGIGVTLGKWTLTADQTVQQINIARRLKADGFILFNYSPVVVTDILPGLRAGVTAEK